MSNYETYPPGPLPTLDIPVRDRYYRICDIAGQDEGAWDGSWTDIPADDLARLSRHAWYALAWYNERYRQMALDDGLKMAGHNTVSFFRYGDLWKFRRMTWSEGPYVFPLEAVPLDELLCIVNDLGRERWAAFCERHPLPCPTDEVGSEHD